VRIRFAVESWILKKMIEPLYVPYEQYNNLLFYLLFIILCKTFYNIYNLLFIRLAVITHN